MNLFDFLNMLWQTARGYNGARVDFIVVYAGIGGAIWVLLLFKVFITEGLNIASGNQTELPRIMVKYLFIALLFTTWPWLADRLWYATVAAAQTFFPDMADLFGTVSIAMTRMSGQSQAESHLRALITVVTNPFAALGTTVLNGLLIIIGMFTLFLCYMLILINIAGSLTILAMNLVIGPVFFALAFDRDFRSIAVSWLTAALSYMLLMPLYGLALHMAASIAGAATPEQWTGFVSAGQIAAQLLGPFMALGIVFSTNKVISALVGGAAGSGLGSSVMGAAVASAGIVSALVPGGGMAKVTAAAAGQTISQAGSSGQGSSSSQSNSQTARSSQSNP